MDAHLHGVYNYCQNSSEQLCMLIKLYIVSLYALCTFLVLIVWESSCKSHSCSKLVSKTHNNNIILTCPFY